MMLNLVALLKTDIDKMLFSCFLFHILHIMLLFLLFQCNMGSPGWGCGRGCLGEGYWCVFLWGLCMWLLEVAGVGVGPWDYQAGGWGVNWALSV